MSALNRRYDIDWLRVIAIGLLLIYHIAIGFQPWGTLIGFITNKDSWQALWVPMAMLNVWRIPLLFFVSGMGVYFAIQKRKGKQLILERAGRILLPFLFGMIFIVPIHIFIWQKHYQMDTSYNYNPGHLWFLGNIFAYVLILSPVFFYLKMNKDGRISQGIAKVLSNPLGLLVVTGAFVAEVLLIDPVPYEMYAMNWHGFFLGLLAFFFGFCFVMAGPTFWEMIWKWKWAFLGIAVLLFILRITQGQRFPPAYLLAIETNLWIFSVLAFGNKYLNRPGKTLSYLCQAAYPVYILHMVFLYLGSMLIFPMDIAVQVKFILLVLFTSTGCFATYEVIRRINLVRPLFGLKRKRTPQAKLSLTQPV